MAQQLSSPMIEPLHSTGTLNDVLLHTDLRAFSALCRHPRSSKQRT